MNAFERIPEYQVTTWEGARIRVTIEAPWMENTATTQMVIDRIEADELYFLELPEHIKMESDHIRQQMLIVDFQSKNERARRVMDGIANNIANHICRHVGAKARER